MTPRQRLEGVIARLGEPFTWNGNEHRGWINFARSGIGRDFLTAGEFDSYGRPFRTALIRADCAAAASQSIIVAGVTYTIRRAVDLRHRGAVVGRLLILVP